MIGVQLPHCCCRRWWLVWLALTCTAVQQHGMWTIAFTHAAMNSGKSNRGGLSGSTGRLSFQGAPLMPIRGGATTSITRLQQATSTKEMGESSSSSSSASNESASTKEGVVAIDPSKVCVCVYIPSLGLRQYILVSFSFICTSSCHLVGYRIEGH
jgi:hypothetical protein